MTKNTVCFVAEGFTMGTKVAMGDHVFPILLLLQLQRLLHGLHLLHLADHRFQGVELDEADLATSTRSSCVSDSISANAALSFATPSMVEGQLIEK